LATYYNNDFLNKEYLAPTSGLDFSVILFLSTSLICFAVLVIRRFAIGGELGGPKSSAYASAGFLVFLWLIYVVMSSLVTYKVFNCNKATNWCSGQPI